MKKFKDTHTYKGWLNSNSFIRRALAIQGYLITVNFIIYIILIAIMVLYFSLTGEI